MDMYNYNVPVYTMYIHICVYYTRRLINFESGRHAHMCAHTHTHIHTHTHTHTHKESTIVSDKYMHVCGKEYEPGPYCSGGEDVCKGVSCAALCQQITDSGHLSTNLQCCSYKLILMSWQLHLYIYRHIYMPLTSIPR